MIKKYTVCIVIAFLTQVSSMLAAVKVEKDVNYTGSDDKGRQLNVFYNHTDKSNPASHSPKDVIIFIHGGSWSSGDKNTYWWLGRNFARKGLVAVTINYGLAPMNEYGQMADDCALAVKWVVQNIASYGGNPARIFLMGHSAGGHLAELINADSRYFKKAGINNPLKGVILNDPFGLDMKEYMSVAKKDNSYFDFLRTFTSDPLNWQRGSPLHYVQHIRNPHLIFYGAKTYPAIQIQSTRLDSLLKTSNIKTILHVIKNKKHVGMIVQMIFGSNQLYDDILTFMKEN